MNKIVVYDKLSWHTSENKDSQNLKFVREYLAIIMNWLDRNNFLTEEGKEILQFGLGEDFSINSAMLTDKGNELLQKHYSSWLKSIAHTPTIDLDYWDRLVEK